MRSTVDQLLELAASVDRTIQNNALVNIALILERSRLPRTWPDTDYAVLLQPDLLSIRLKKSEQIEIVQRLCNLATTDRTHSTMLWAIGKAAPSIGIAPLLMLLRTRSREFDEETMYQALIALENFLVAKKGTLFPDIAVAIKSDDPRPLLENLSRSESPRIAGNAQRILESLYRNLEVPGAPGR